MNFSCAVVGRPHRRVSRFGCSSAKLFLDVVLGCADVALVASAFWVAVLSRGLLVLAAPADESAYCWRCSSRSMAAAIAASQSCGRLISPIFRSRLFPQDIGNPVLVE